MASLNNVQNIPPNSCTTDDWSNSSSLTTLHTSHHLAESPLATNSSRDILDSDSKRLEDNLQTALEIVVKAYRRSGLAETVTRRAHTKLKALNVLVHGLGDASSLSPKDHFE